MSQQGAYRERNYDVGELLLSLRLRIKLTQNELAAVVEVGRRTLQSWESGDSYPLEEKLEQLIATFQLYGAFTLGQELEEARHLWQQVSQNTQRRLTAFDEHWFANLRSIAAQISFEEQCRIHQRLNWAESLGQLSLKHQNSAFSWGRRKRNSCRLARVLPWIKGQTRKVEAVSND